MDQVLVSAGTGVFAVNVGSGNISWQLNETNGGKYIVPFADSRILCVGHSSKALLHYYRLQIDGAADSGGNSVYKCSCPEKFTAMAFSSCGGLMFAGTGSGTIYIYQTWTGYLLKQWTAHFGVITKIVLSLNDSVLYTTSEDSTLKMYNLPEVFESTSVVSHKMSISPHSGSITDMCMMHSQIATGSTDCSVKLFTSDCLVQVEKWTLPSAVEKVSGGNGAIYAGCADGSVWVCPRGALPTQFGAVHAGRVTGLGLGLDGSRLVSCGEEGLKIFDTLSFAQVLAIAGPQQQLKGSVGLLMMRTKPPRSSHLVSAIDSYLTFKPLSRILTSIDSIDRIPLIKVHATNASQKMKADKLFCISDGVVFKEDQVEKLQKELTRQRELTQIWSKNCADLFTRLSLVEDVVLDIPIGNSEGPLKKKRNSRS